MIIYINFKLTYVVNNIQSSKQIAFKKEENINWCHKKQTNHQITPFSHKAFISISVADQWPERLCVD